MCLRWLAFEEKKTILLLGCSSVKSPLSLLHDPTIVQQQTEKKRKDYAFWRQFNEKPSITPGCPVKRLTVTLSFGCANNLRRLSDTMFALPVIPFTQLCSFNQSNLRLLCLVAGYEGYLD